ncbi:MAG: response regulator transcription factor [Caldilineaceae bacterium]
MLSSGTTFFYFPHPLLVIGSEELLERCLQPLMHEKQQPLLKVDTATAALSLLANYAITAVLLNGNMLGANVYSICTELRQQSKLPIVVVNRRQGSQDRVAGIESGADHCLAMPFAPQELAARIQATQRRMGQATLPGYWIVCGDLLLNPLRQQVCIDQSVIHLTTNEYRLLQYLIRNPNRAIQTEELLRQLWGGESGEDLSIVRIMVHRLRNKIEQDPTAPHYIHTIFGVGYRFCPTPAAFAVKRATANAGEYH